MPVPVTYPGVYLQELNSGGAHTIVGAATSTTAFIGFFARGPVLSAQKLSSFADFQNIFGGLDDRSEASYQVMQFFLNGGQVALAVRVAAASAASASGMLSAASPAGDGLRVSAANPGAWGNHLYVAATQDAVAANAAPTFTLTVQQRDRVGNIVTMEVFRGLSADRASAQNYASLIESQSQLLAVPPEQLAPNVVFPAADSHPVFVQLAGGSDGAWDVPTQEFANALLAVLDPTQSPLATSAPQAFNILSLAATAELPPAQAAPVIAAAQSFCRAHRAFYIVDIPNSQTVASPQAMTLWVEANQTALTSDFAAVYYPRLLVDDPLDNLLPREIASSGSLAGVYAETDQSRGVWKAPAGLDAGLSGVQPVYAVNDLQNGLLNPLGINAIRTFPVQGVVSWGSRTLQGTDQLDSQWKYIPVRRLALYLESSLTAGLQWVVFEPNGPTLWASIRLTVAQFMMPLYQQGAFAGATADQAFFVRCDATTTTQADIDQGIVNIVVGFAPLQPAEFIVLQIQQIAGNP